MNLTTQDAQVACFRNAAAHLKPGGCFVVEVGSPSPPRSRGPDVAPSTLANGWGFDLYDVATQAMSSNYIQIVDGPASASRSRSATCGRPSSI